MTLWEKMNKRQAKIVATELYALVIDGVYFIDTLEFYPECDVKDVEKVGKELEAIVNQLFYRIDKLEEENG